MSEVLDLIIIGSGPAGLTAAIYASRAKLNTLVIEKSYSSGGQILSTYEVDNYPGLPGISGMELASKLREHAQRLEAKFIMQEVKRINIEENIKEVITNKETFMTKSVIIATGASHRTLGVPGENELAGMGVSYCATCDGAFFKEKEVCVIGGGDVAIEDAIFLARICKKVNLIHRRDELRGAKSLQDKLFSLDNVNVIWNSVVEKINGCDKVESIEIKNVLSSNIQKLSADGVFIAVGIEPNMIELSEKIEETQDKYIFAEEDCQTNIKGIFVAGDLRKKGLRQIVTAVSDGANAITSVEKYINSL